MTILIDILAFFGLCCFSVLCCFCIALFSFLLHERKRTSVHIIDFSAYRAQRLSEQGDTPC